MYSLDDLNIEILREFNFKIELSEKKYKEIYFIKDDFELILNYELERKIILLDSSKIELIFMDQSKWREQLWLIAKNDGMIAVGSVTMNYLKTFLLNLGSTIF